MQPKTTKKGFLMDGMLDENVQTYPDIFKMLKPCKLQYFKKEYEALFFFQLLQVIPVYERDWCHT